MADRNAISWISNVQAAAARRNWQRFSQTMQRGDDLPKPRAYDEGGTNPAGFPVMPERDRHAWLREACERPVEPASVVLPFDAFLAARERTEPEPYDPREGDEVEVHVGDAPNYTGVFARFSEDGDFVIRYRDLDGYERSVSVNPCYVTLVRRPGGVR